MKKLNNYFGILLLIVFTAALYFYGCSSAESTTGKLAFQQRDYEKAERELLKGLKIDKNDDEGWYMLGYSQIQLGKYEEAEKSFKTCLSVSNKYGDYIVAFWAENYNEGARMFGEGINSEKKRDSVNAIRYYTKALTSFKSASHILPDSIKSLKAIGECYLALGQDDEAMKVFNFILSKSKSREDAEKVASLLFDAGLGMIKMSNYESAATTFEKIMSIEALPKDDPYYETSIYNYALSKAKIGEKIRDEKPDSDEHKQYFRDALAKLELLTVSLKKKDLEILVYELLVGVYANLGETKKAQDALKKKEELEKNKK